jgi:hypothetical protein
LQAKNLKSPFSLLFSVYALLRSGGEVEEEGGRELMGITFHKHRQVFAFWQLFQFFVVLCGYPHKNQRGLELKIILSIENDEEPFFLIILVF